MDRSTAIELLAASSALLEQASRAEKAILALPRGQERSQLLRGLAELISLTHTSLRLPATAQYPELDEQEDLPSEPDTALDADEQAYVHGLDSLAIAEVDKRLLAECSSQWLKAARVIGAAMSHLPGTPLGFLAQRLIALASAGRLEATGDLNYIRFSEVRLGSSSAA